MGRILIVGAKSDIAKAVAREYATQGYDLCLAAREIDELQDFAQDIRVRLGRDVKLKALDILEYQSHRGIYNSIKTDIIGAVVAVGFLGDQKEAQCNFLEAEKIINTNYTGIASFLSIVACDFELREEGFIVCISSVAGDRGRASNYMYGSAKSALTSFLSGLRSRLYDKRIHVMTVKPGFVDTRMTRNMELPRMLTSKPEEVANKIYYSQQKKKSVLYVGSIWFLIMTIIKLIPENIFKRLNL